MKRAIWVIWPSFLMAGLIEMLIFAIVDPSDLQALAHLDWSRNTIYSLVFLLLWCIVALSSALTLFLSTPDSSSIDASVEAGAAATPGTAPR